MSTRQKTRWLTAAAACIGLAGAAVLALGLGVPVEAPSGKSDSTVPAMNALASKAGRAELPAKPAIEEMQQLCAIDLRRPLFDPPPVTPPPVAPAAAAAPASALSLRLVGTIVEPGYSMAMLQKPDGSIALCAQGQSIDDPAGKVTVTKVEGLKATVTFAGQSIELAVPRPPAPVPLTGQGPQP